MAVGPCEKEMLRAQDLPPGVAVESMHTHIARWGWRPEGVRDGADPMKSKGKNR